MFHQPPQSMLLACAPWEHKRLLHPCLIVPLSLRHRERQTIGSTPPGRRSMVWGINYLGGGSKGEKHCLGRNQGSRGAMPCNGAAPACSWRKRVRRGRYSVYDARFRRLVGEVFAGSDGYPIRLVGWYPADGLYGSPTCPGSTAPVGVTQIGLRCQLRTTPPCRPPRCSGRNR